MRAWRAFERFAQAMMDVDGEWFPLVMLVSGIVLSVEIWWLW